MKTFLVGGAVRDQILGLPIKDRDWVVVGATPQMMLDAGFSQVGKDFPVFLHPETGEEHALARKERSTGSGYDAFEFDTDPSVTLEEDLERRDLTMNSIAMDDEGNFIDPFGGVKDIENRVIRHTSDAFAEDPVRILRVARFMARFSHLGFMVDGDTLDLMTQMVSDGEVKHLVAERVWQELEGALSEKSPLDFFAILFSIDAFDDVCPEFGHAFCTGGHVLNLMGDTTVSKQVLFSIFCAKLSRDEVENMVDRIKMPNDFSDLLMACVSVIPTLRVANTMDADEILKLVKLMDFRRKPRKVECILLVADIIGVDITQINFINTVIFKLMDIDEATIAETTEHKKDIAENINSARIRCIEKCL